MTGKFQKMKFHWLQLGIWGGVVWIWAFQGETFFCYKNLSTCVMGICAFQEFSKHEVQASLSTHPIESCFL